MKKLKVLLYGIGIAQIVLGVLSLFFPAFFIETAMKLTAVSPDMGYALGMLASRFFVFGVLLFVAAKNPPKHLLLIDAMIAVQSIDLLAGIAYTSLKIVPFSAAALPMFDAAIFIVLLTWWRPRPAGEKTV